MTKNLYVGNMNYATTRDRLVELFETHGQVTSVNLITDRDSGDSYLVLMNLNSKEGTTQG